MVSWSHDSRSVGFCRKVFFLWFQYTISTYPWAIWRDYGRVWFWEWICLLEYASHQSRGSHHCSHRGWGCPRRPFFAGVPTRCICAGRFHRRKESLFVIMSPHLAKTTQKVHSILVGTDNLCGPPTSRIGLRLSSDCYYLLGVELTWGQCYHSQKKIAFPREGWDHEAVETEYRLSTLCTHSTKTR